MTRVTKIDLVTILGCAKFDYVIVNLIGIHQLFHGKVFIFNDVLAISNLLVIKEEFVPYFEHSSVAESLSNAKNAATGADLNNLLAQHTCTRIIVCCIDKLGSETNL